MSYYFYYEFYFHVLCLDHFVHELQKNQRSMDVSACVAMQMICLGISV